MNITINRLFNFALPPPTRDLVAAWNLSDVSDSAGANTLTNNGGATFVTGRIGNAVLTDGVNDFLSIADNAALSMGAGINFTMAFWFKVTAMPGVGNVGHILGKGDVGANFEYVFDITDTGIFRFIVSNDGTALTMISSAAGVIVPDVWYFVVCWYDGVAIRLENNNSGLITSLAFTADVFNGVSNFTIGSRGAGTFYNGLVDAVRIYKRVLTAAERSTLYNNGVGREYVANTTIASDEVNRELNQIINLFNGITKDVTPTIISTETSDPVLSVNQNGAGPIAQFNTNTVKAELLANGQIKSYVPVGTAPLLFDVPSGILVTNLNVDLLDGLDSSAFLLLGAIGIDHVYCFFDGVPSIGDTKFIPTMEGNSLLDSFLIQQRNSSASAFASTTFAVKKDNNFETLIANIGGNNGNNVEFFTFTISPVAMDTARMIIEVSNISGSPTQSDFTIIARYRHTSSL